MSRKNPPARKEFNKEAGRPPVPGVLAKAVEHGDLSVVKALLARGANPNENNAWGVPAIHVAIRRTDMLHALIDAGADVDAKGTGGEPPLTLAARCGYTDTVALLIARRAKIDEKDRYGDTALMWSAHWNYAAITRMLLAAGADPDIRGVRGDTALYKAAGPHGLNNVPREETEKTARQSLALFLEHGANADIANDRGETPLMHAVTWTEDVAVTAMLLEKTANINARDGAGDTALTKAATARNLDKLRLILAKNPDLGVKNDDGDTALIAVARHARQLKAWDAEKDPEEGAYIHFTADTQARLAEAGALLIKRGADTTAKNNAGETVFGILGEIGCADLAETFRAAYEERQHALAVQRRQDMLRRLHRKSAGGKLRP